MVSTYSPSLRLELMATGDQSGTWGVTTNTNLGTLLEQAITGVLSKPMADADQTLTDINGAPDEARNAVVSVTGVLTAARNVVVPAAEKLYLFRNDTTGGFAVTIKTPAGTGVSVPYGTARWVYCDGTNVVDGMAGAQGYSYTGNFLFVGNRSFSLLDEAGTGLVFGNTNPAPDGVTLRIGGANVLDIRSGVAEFDVATLRAVSINPGTPGAILELYHESPSPTAGDVVGNVIFYGRNTLPGKQEYAHIEAQCLTASPGPATAEGALIFYVTASGIPTEIGRLNSTELLLGQTAGWNPGTTALRGINITKNGQFIASNVSLPAGSFVRMTSNGRVLNTYRDTTNVGGATVTTTATSWDTSSDERLKDFIGVYDPLKAISIIRRDPVRDFHWNHYMGEGAGTYAVGWGAQTSYEVSKDLATPGIGSPGEPDFQPWGVDQGKRTPYLWAAVTWLLDERDKMFERLERMEARLQAIGA